MLSKPKLIFKVLILIVSISVIGLIAKQVLATASEWNIKKNASSNNILEFNYSDAATPQMTLTTGGVVNAAGYTLNNGPMSGMTMICDIVFASTTNSVTLPNNSANCPGTTLPQTYKDLEINISGVGSNSGSTWVNLSARFNGDSTANYNQAYQFSGVCCPGGNGGGALAVDRSFWGWITVGPSILTGQTAISVKIINYASTQVQKGVISAGSAAPNGTYTLTYTTNGSWASAAAITTITIAPTGDFVTFYPFLAGSRITIYGLR